MFYNLIRFIVVNFGVELGKLDDYHGYKIRLITILFPSVCVYGEDEKLTISKFQLMRSKRRRLNPIWNKPKLAKFYKAIRKHAKEAMRAYKWDRDGNYQIIPNGFVFYHETCEHLFQESVRIGFNIQIKRDWYMLDNPIFIGFRLRYGEDW